MSTKRLVTRTLTEVIDDDGLPGYIFRDGVKLFRQTDGHVRKSRYPSSAPGSWAARAQQASIDPPPTWRAQFPSALVTAMCEGECVDYFVSTTEHITCRREGQQRVFYRCIRMVATDIWREPYVAPKRVPFYPLTAYPL